MNVAVVVEVLALAWVEVEVGSSAIHMTFGATHTLATYIY